MKFTEHVELSDWNGKCLLTVRNVELHDFLDDFFTEHDLEMQVVRPPGNPEQHQLLFPPAVSKATVYSLLSQVEPQEIERIVRINSGASGSAGGA
jgi:hypothetical protein